MVTYLIFRVLELLLTVLLVIIPNLAFTYILLRFKKDYSKFYILGLVAITVIYFNKLFLGYTLAQPDFNRFLVPFFNFFGQSLRSFSAPLWNPNFGYGFDNWRIFTAPFFGPFAFLSAFFGVYTFLNIYLIIQHLILLIGGFVFGKVLKMKSSEAFAFAIFWAFNGWVCMRFNQGVGYEYLISYKWLPWALASAILLAQKKNFDNILLLGLCLGFLFEGTPNIGIIASLLVVLYFLLLGDFSKKFREGVFRIAFSCLVGMLFFLPKILPALLAQDTTSYSNRLMWDATGWREGLISLSTLPKYFFPYNGNGVSERFFFTPGMLGAILFLLYLINLIFRVVRKKKVERLEKTFLAIFLFGLVISTDNILSRLFWMLPVLRKVTRIPSALIFISVSLPYFIILAVGKIAEFCSCGACPRQFENQLATTRGRRYRKLFFRMVALILPFIIGLMIFTEVLLGPSFFGVDSYTFNFIKFKPAEELLNFNYLNNFSNSLVFTSKFEDVTLPIYASSLAGVRSINSQSYFLSSVFVDLKESRNNMEAFLNTYNPRYVFSPVALKLRRIRLVDIYSVDKLSHKERSFQMEGFRLIGKWDGNLYVYENEEFDSTWINLSSISNEFSISSEAVNKRNGILPLSYNSNWISLSGDALGLDKESSLMKIQRTNFNTIRLIYFPWVVYASFLPMCLVFVFLIFRRSFVGKRH